MYNSKKFVLLTAQNIEKLIEALEALPVKTGSKLKQHELTEAMRQLRELCFAWCEIDG